MKASAADLLSGRGRHACPAGWLRAGLSWARRTAAGAAVAVIAVVLAVALTACGGAGGPPVPCGSVPSPQPPGWAADPAAIGSYVASGLVPRYYVAVSDDGAGAFVRATATGRTLATILPPAAGQEIAAVTGAPGDRTFILQARGLSNAAYAFYLFHLSSSGRPGALNRLTVPVPGGETTDGIAVSPDADKLAVALVSGPADQELSIDVYTLATGAVRIWTAISPTGLTIMQGESTLSWTQDERRLSFPWGAGRSAASTGVRLLRLDAPGGNLLTASRTRLSGTGHGWVCSGIPVITPDGKTLACGAVSAASSAASDHVAGVAEYDAASGILERVLGQHQSAPDGASLWWANTSGNVLIGSIQGPFSSCPMALPPTVGVFTANRFVALPGMPEPLTASFAW
jgi:hypothetical protein